MPCYHPLQAYRKAGGGVSFAVIPGTTVPVKLPCGQCIGCRLARSREWAVRITHEAQLYARNVFVTLTYRDDRWSLDYADFQAFMKALRHQMAPSRCRFFMCGEYGEQYHRGHFHACLFNVGFDDAVYWGESSPGNPIYRSATLERLWPHGFSSFGDVTFESAAYVARYVCKKVTGSEARERYSRVDTETGEITERMPEFARMSLKPGIGARWLEKFESDVFPVDYVVARGIKQPVPRYYGKLLEAKYGDRFAKVKDLRKNAVVRSDQTPDRLAVREAVAKARQSFKKRTLE